MKAPRSLSWPAAALVVVACAAACSKQSPKPADVDKTPPPPQEVQAVAVTPASVPVLVQAELPSGQDLGSAGAVVDAISPGASAMAGGALPGMLGGLVQAQGLDGARLDLPVRVIILDPKQHPEPAVLLVTVGDEAALAQAVGKERLVIAGGMALIGAPGAVEAARAYALGSFAKQPAPDRPRVVAFMQPVLGSFRAEIAQAKTQIAAMLTMLAAQQGQAQGQDASGFVQLYVDALLALFEQTETVELTLAGHGGFAGAELVFRPRADTLFAGFAGAQKPTDFALLGKLPAMEEAAMVMAGRLTAGPARGAVVDLGKRFMEAMFGGALGEELMASMDDWLDLFQGDFAAWASSPMAGLEMAYLMPVTDSAKAMAYSHQMAQAMAANKDGLQILGMKQTITYEPKAFTHDGVAVAEQHVVIDLDSVPPEQRAAMERMGSGDTSNYVAGFDGYMGLATGQPDIMRALIDTIRGKGPRFAAEGVRQGALDLARTRKDSVLMAMDFALLASGSGAPMPPNMPRAMVMSLGFAGGDANLFLGMSR